ncbi:endonuclease/exonuclease/phosphatase family protein [Maribacter sp. 2-571]|uniref:endonuclease/exonuclease/phosphatase family protein n=1 Tax=Maribacter sp. 2-571 TaxID=3417569 RepID=UPI003D358649
MKYFYLNFLLFTGFLCYAQEGTQYRIRTIAFYNLENLFDIENDSLTFDDDRTPEGRRHWTLERYEKKLSNLAKVISEIGSDVTGTSPDVIGICEVENIKVIKDLISQPVLLPKAYGIVHYDSPDERGIDVALLYKKAAFLPTASASHRLILQDDAGNRNYTRDQLVVSGLLDGTPMHFLVNHWPSRSGGQARSAPNRIAAAKLNKRIIDSVQRLHPDAKLIGMGDLNDDPIDDSLKKVLKTKGNGKATTEAFLFNPMEKLFKKGIGSLAYRDEWNLFDQLYFTSNLLSDHKGTFRYWKSGIFTAPYLLNGEGQYKGYPFRTYAGGNYAGGYSDHLPVYLYLIREEGE